jgi:hypothetical protein
LAKFKPITPEEFARAREVDPELVALAKVLADHMGDGDHVYDQADEDEQGRYRSGAESVRDALKYGIA